MKLSLDMTMRQKVTFGMLGGSILLARVIHLISMVIIFGAHAQNYM